MEKQYVIITDTGCDLPLEMLEKMGVLCVPLNVFMKDNPAQPCTLTGAAFYQALREGQVACTSAANLGRFRETYCPLLEAGKDILYLSFSSALSCMFATAKLAEEELSAEYPDRKIITIDGLSASMGQGLLLYFAVHQREKGASIEELEQYLLNHRLRISHWFTVDDLMFLKRGGRLSSMAAIAGTLLGIKPVLRVTHDGKLVAFSKVRGRKNALLELAKHFHEEVEDPTQQIYISQADDMDAAVLVKETLEREYGAKNVLIGDIGAVIGAHAGPGTVALFFMAKEPRKADA